MGYKHIETIGAYGQPGRGTVLLTLDRTLKRGEVIEANGKLWRVIAVELSDVTPHASVVVAAFTESDAKKETAKESKRLLDAMFPSQVAAALAQPEENDEGVDSPVTSLSDALVVENHPTAKMISETTNVDEEKLRLMKVLTELTSHMCTVRDWTLQQLDNFELGKDPPSVLVLVLAMPRTAMQEYVKGLEKFLVSSIKSFDTAGKLPWANVKAVAGSKQ